jgi:hypothetical protein
MVTMVTEGTDVWKTMKTELQAAKDDLARCQQSAAQFDARMRDLLARRGHALLQLAQHYLPEVSRPAVEATFGAIRSDLLGIVARKESRQRDLERQLNASEDETRRRGGELDELTKRLNAKVAERERLEAQVAETLKGNDDFQQRSKLALQAEEQLHRNEQRVAEIEREAAEKIPYYEQSRLFRYLYDRGFGTTEYQASGLTRGIDSWVARLIDFGNARIGYDYLRKTPKLVAEEVARRREQFNQLMQQVEAIQHAQADKAGLTAVLEEGEALGDKRDLLVQEIKRLREKAQSLQQALAGLARSQNEFYTEAIGRFSDFLGATKLTILQKRASETPEAVDDALVSELAGLNQQNEDLTRHLDELAESRAVAERAQEGLDLVAQRYRQANFDSQRSYFDGDFDIASLLSRFREGALDADNLWRAIQSAQQFRPHWVESTSPQVGPVNANPSGRVILGAILDAVNAAMQQAAVRGVQRRGEDFNPFPTFPSSFPSPGDSFPSGPTSFPDFSPPSPGGSFTTEDGF